MPLARPPRARMLAAVTLALACCAAAAHAAGAPPLALVAPGVRPWTPPGLDSAITWAAEAKALFRAQPDDSVDDATHVAFDHVAAIARRYLMAIGRGHMTEAPAIKGALDSLGLNADIVQDPSLPDFQLVLVHNPFRHTAHAVAFLFWFRGDRLLEQGFEVPAGLVPKSRIFWLGDPNAPYIWSIVGHGLGDPPRFSLFVMALTADGGFWRPIQYPGHGPDLGNALQAEFNDVNGDGIPELVTWGKAPPDSLFTECAGCPPRLTERLYIYRKYEAYSLEDSRLVSGPYAVFVLFIRFLLDKNRPAASRLLEDPAKYDEAIGLGWGTRRAPGTWAIEFTEEERWPRWFQCRFMSPRGAQHYVVKFAEKDGRWIIKEWKPAPTAPAVGAK